MLKRLNESMKQIKFNITKIVCKIMTFQVIMNLHHVLTL